MNPSSVRSGVGPGVVSASIKYLEASKCLILYTRGSQPPFRTNSPFKSLPTKKTEHGTLVPCSADFFPDQCSGRILTLLQCQASARAACAGRIEADHTRHVRAEHALTGGANRDRGSGDRVAEGRRIAVASPLERVAALGAGCENLVKQACARRGCNARGCGWAHGR